MVSIADTRCAEILRQLAEAESENRELLVQRLRQTEALLNGPSSRADLDALKEQASQTREALKASHEKINRLLQMLLECEDVEI